MIPRADVESMPYLVSLVSVMLYIYILQIFNVRRRWLERVGVILSFLGLSTPITVSMYYLYTFDLSVSYVFEYTYSGMSPLERVSTIIYSSPWDFLLLLLGIALLVLRSSIFKGLYRRVVRKSLEAYLFGVMAIPLVLVFYPPFEYLGDVVALDGKGLHPMTLGIGVPLLMTTYVSFVLALVVGSIGTYLWMEPDDKLAKQVEKMLFVTIILLSVSLFLRMFYNSIYMGRSRLFNYTLVDISILSVLVASILLFHLFRISRSRVLGASAVASYILMWTSITGMATLVPDNFFPVDNTLNTGVYIAILLSTLFTSSFSITRELFRRSFLPWFSDKEDALVIVGSTVVLLSIVLSIMIVIFNVSIYSTFGEGRVRISDDFINSSLFILSVYPVISLIGSYLASRYRSINAVIFGVFGVYALFAGGYNYNLWFIKSFIGYIFLLSAPLAIYIYLKRGVIPLARLVFAFVFGLMIFSQVTFDEGPAVTIDAGGEETVYGLRLSNPVYDKVVYNVSVYKDPLDNSTESMLIVEEASFEGGIVIRRYSYEARDIRFSENFLIDSLPNMYLLGLIIGSDTSVSIYVSRAYWGMMLYILMPVLLIISVYLVSRYELY